VERKDIDIIDVCTPTHLHRDIVLAAAANGKQIFCEKPIALSYAEAREMYEAAEKAGVLHYLNHNYRRTPAIAFAKQLIEDGRSARSSTGAARICRTGSPIRTPPDMAPAEGVCRRRAALRPGLPQHGPGALLVGEVEAVSAILKTFITERPLAGKGAGTLRPGRQAPGPAA